MKKLLLSLGLLLFVFGGATAQGKYSYLKEQKSPFNGEFNEPRYVDVDSISYVYYQNRAFAEHSSMGLLEAEDFTEANGGYTLIKRSSDGLTDTLKRILYPHPEGVGITYTKKYSDEGRLVYSSSIVDYSIMTDIEEKKYLYDAEGRISEITTTKNNDGAATVMVYDTVKFDYELKPYATSVTIEVNTIYTKNDSMLVYYFDDGYQIIENAFQLYEEVNTQYLFDNQNRLISTTRSFSNPVATASDSSENATEYKEPIIVEYKYTENGYEEYENGIKKTEYKFQNDGYCTDIIQYAPSDAAVFPPIYSIKSMEKISYFKNGEVIVGNESFEEIAPKAYGVQGGIAINTEKALLVSIYSFSGSLVKQENVSAGNNTIPLSKGIYVVVIGQMSYKVFVR